MLPGGRLVVSRAGPPVLPRAKRPSPPCAIPDWSPTGPRSVPDRFPTDVRPISARFPTRIRPVLRTARAPGARADSRTGPGTRPNFPADADGASLRRVRRIGGPLRAPRPRAAHHTGY
ncbi:hypothetical protein GCM10027570_15860 [Streptomonospora sediminis]